MFKSVRNAGFQIKFSNGYVVSCQFGFGTYSTNKWGVPFGPDDLDKERSEYINRSQDCEVAILYGGDFVTSKILEDMGSELGCDDLENVVGYVSADDVGKIISYLVNLKD